MRRLIFGFPLLSALLLANLGCERKERIVEVETPNGDVTVDKNIDTGEVEVESDAD